MDTQSPTNQLESALSNLLAHAVSDSVAPGLIAVVFNRDGIVAQAANGVADISTGAKITPSTTIWHASKSKGVNSIAVLRLVEREGFDLDSYDDLVKVLPELAIGSGELVSKVFGEKKEDGTYELNEGKNKPTLRHLLSHTTGLSYIFFSEELGTVYEPAGTVPGLPSGKKGCVNVPRVFDYGEGWAYGCSTDWLGLFVERVYKTHLPQAYRELVFQPLGIADDELAAFYTEEMKKDRSAVHMKIGGPQKWAALPSGVTGGSVTFEGEIPPEGYFTPATAPLQGTLRGFAAFARSLLNKSAPSASGTPLISEKLWKEAAGDNLAKVGLSLPSPYVLKTVVPTVSNDVKVWSEPADEESKLGEGWSLLQMTYARAKTATGREPGSLSWAGLANSYFFVDPVSGVGGVVAAQFYPFADAKMLELRDEFERLIFGNPEAWK